MPLRLLRALGVLGVFLTYLALCPKLFDSRARVSLDDNVLSVVAFENDPVRAEASANQAARETVRRIGFENERQAEEQARVRSAAEAKLVDFVDRHPDLLVVAPKSGNRANPARITLEKERERVQAQLAVAEHAPRPPQAESSHTDNPFDDGSGTSPARLRRRLAEIDSTLAAAERAAQQVQPSAELLELQKLVLTLPSFPAPTKPTTRVVDAGSRPQPLDPDRVFLLLAGLAGGLAAALLPTTSRARARPEPEPGARLQTPTLQALAVQPRTSSPTLGSMVPVAHPSLMPAGAEPAGSPVLAYPVAFLLTPSTDLDRYTELKHRLDSLSERECFAVAVTAAHSSHGKALVAASLASVYCNDPSARVLLLEADLAEPAIHQLLSLEMSPRTDFGRQLQACLDGEPASQWRVSKCSPALHVLASATRTPELLRTIYFERCMLQLKPYYDVIIVHAPPLSDQVGSRAVNDVVDGVILAYRDGDPTAGGPATPFIGKRLMVAVPVARA